jgi:hypothetical protein
MNQYKSLSVKTGFYIINMPGRFILCVNNVTLFNSCVTVIPIH